MIQRAWRRDLESSGISASQVLWEDSETVFCRAFREGGSELPSVLVVTSTSEIPAPAVLSRLAHYHSLRPILDVSWAAPPVELIRSGGRTILVLNDPGGEPLSALVGPPMVLSRFLRVAIGMVGAVERAHESGLIHRDIKPGHFLLDPVSGEAWLTGFGIASRLQRERQSLQAGEMIAGTFAYMSPEQTGRVNRSIDARSDLYSLGVVFYEMISGRLPFDAGDPSQWIHSHVARQPLDLAARRHDIPVAVSAIVMKLLSKAADDRYQTARGLRLDLQRCLHELERDSQVTAFQIGQQDASGNLLFREKLYGRDAEVGRVLDAFGRVVVDGRPGLVLLSGPSGIGKSSVVNELHRALLPGRGFFASGKFDQYKSGIPYAPLGQAFQGLIRQILATDEVDLEHWRNGLANALGLHGQLIVNLVPELELIIGEQPPIPDLTGRESQSRFRATVRQFLEVFARPEHPLVLFLDDLQWLDAATLDVFEYLSLLPELGNILIVGAYRNNELRHDHPLAGCLATIRSSRADIIEIQLGSISAESVVSMVADALGSDPEKVAPLAEIALGKTSGSPFFVIQFMHAIADEGLLTHDGSQWDWDTAVVQHRHVSDNVVDLMIERLNRLPRRSRELLSDLACLGERVSIDRLCKFKGLLEAEVESQLSAALQSDLIFRIDDAYAFAHDRVQEAVYVMLPEEERQKKHRLIAARLLQAYGEDHLDDQVFELASHLLRGGNGEIASAERKTAALVLLRAGLKARAAAAYAEACKFLSAGSTKLGDNGWTADYDLAFELALQHAECLFLAGDITGAETQINKILRAAKTKAHMAAAYRLRTELYIVQSRNEEGVKCGLEALRVYGLNFTPHPSREEVQLEFACLERMLQGRGFSVFESLPPMTDPDMLALMPLMAELLTPSFFTDFNLIAVIACRIATTSLEHGQAIYQGYAWLGIILGHAFERWEDADRVGELTIQLAAARNSILDASRVHQTMGLITCWTRPLSEAVDWYRTAYKLGVSAGDVYYSCFAAAQIVSVEFQRGMSLIDVNTEANEYLRFARQIGYQNGADLIAITERASAVLLAKDGTLTEQCNDIFGQGFEDSFSHPRLSTTVQWYWSRKLMLHFLAGEYELALEASAKGDPGPRLKELQIRSLDYSYYTVLATAACLEGMDPHDRLKSLDRIVVHHRQIKEWAEKTGSKTFADKFALTSAIVASIEGRVEDAERFFEVAIREAKENGFLQNEAISYELAAHFYKRRGLESIASLYLRQSRDRYLAWGAVAKVRQLDDANPDLDKQPSLSKAATTSLASVERLELSIVLKVSQAIASEMDQDRLLERLMRLVIEQAAAERALLFLLDDDGLYLGAELPTPLEVLSSQRNDSRLPEGRYSAAVLHYTGRTGETVVLDDATADQRFRSDNYIRDNGVRSVLAMPLLNGGKTIGQLYLENNLATRVFTPDRVAVLTLIASQAAIALENTRLYRELEEREARFRSLVESDIIGIMMWKIDGLIFDANEAFLRIVGYEREDLIRGCLRWTEMSPPEGKENDERVVEEVLATGTARPWEKEFIRKDGSRVPVMIGATSFGGAGATQGIAFVLDLSERKQAAQAAHESEKRYIELQSVLAHANRVATMGHLSGAIAHEVKQPLVAVVTSGGAGLNWLSATPPDIDAARRALERIVSEGHRAGEILDRTRAMLRKSAPDKEPVDLNEIVSETVGLLAPESRRRNVALEVALDPLLPEVLADRVQIQQVVLNLAMNAFEAMDAADPVQREVLIVTERLQPTQILVTVRDTGPGIPDGEGSQLFEEFFTTKPDGMGMGLAISKGIVEAHNGKIWAEPNKARGAVIRFTLPIGDRQPTV